MRIAAALVAMLLVATGACSRPDHVASPVQWGVVDKSLPPEQRARQAALQRLFRALQSGTSLEHIKAYEPDLDFREKEAAFLEGGIQLRSWGWIDRPQGDRLRVRLVFVLDEPPGDKTIEYERTYRVNRTQNRFEIVRAN